MSIAKTTAVTWPASFCERDRPTALRRRREQVEAALGRLAGQRAGQGDDRPQPEQDRQGVADAPGQEPAHRLDVDRLAEEAAQGRRQRGQSGDEQAPQLDRRELGATRTARRCRS